MVRMGPLNITIVDHKNRPLPEFLDPASSTEDPHQIVTRYVQTPPANEDQTFRFKVTAVQPVDPTHLNANGYTIWIICDGFVSEVYPLVFGPGPSTEQAIREGKNYEGKIGSFYVRNENMDHMEARSMKFKPVHTTADPNEAIPGLVNQDTFGMIELEMKGVLRFYFTDDDSKEPTSEDLEKFLYYKTAEKVSSQLEDESDTQTLHPSLVHEKDVKASCVSHCVELGKIKNVMVSPSKRPNISYAVGPSPRKIRFKYRSKDALEALGIIPFESLMPKDTSGNLKESFTIQEHQIEKKHSAVPEKVMPSAPVPFECSRISCIIESCRMAQQLGTFRRKTRSCAQHHRPTSTQTSHQTPSPKSAPAPATKSESRLGKFWKKLCNRDGRA